MKKHFLACDCLKSSTTTPFQDKWETKRCIKHVAYCSDKKVKENCMKTCLDTEVSQRMSSKDSCMSANFLANTSHIIE